MIRMGAWSIAVMWSTPWIVPLQVIVRHHGRIVWLLDPMTGT